MWRLVVGVVAARARGEESEAPSLVLALMVRNEEANLRANLPLWGDVADAVVCGVDERTTDESARSVAEALPRVPRWVFSFRFDNFGQGRTVVLGEAWRKFPNASHVLSVDPDWRPADELVKQELDMIHRTFVFLVWDRNGLTTRNLNWLVRHEPGLRFEHRLHEQLARPSVDDGGVKRLSWEVVEREGRTSWHTAEGHGHSQSYRRYLNDLRLLELDLDEWGPEDPHTLYYLGATHLSALEAMVGIGEHERTAETDAHVFAGIDYLERRVAPRVASRSPGEQTWASLRWLAHANHYYARNLSAAEAWYKKCVAYDPARVDCLVFSSALFRETGRPQDAWRASLAGLATPFETGDRVFAHNFYVHRCSLPIEAALSLLGLLQRARRDEAWDVLAVFGDGLLGRAACDDPTRGFITARPEEVRAAARAYADLRPTATCASRKAARAAANHDESHLAMMKRWGLEVCK